MMDRIALATLLLSILSLSLTQVQSAQTFFNLERAEHHLQLEKALVAINNGEPVRPKKVLGQLKDHFVDWFERIDNNFQDMFATIGKGIDTADDELIAQELEYFMNCHSCKMTVKYMRELIKDPFNKQLVSSFLSTHCQSKFSPTTCNELIYMYTEVIHENVFEFIFHDDFICHYAIPLCDGDKYEELKAEDYIADVLADKPKVIESDDYMDAIYEKIAQEGEDFETYNVMQISDWHVDYNYKVGSNRYCNDEICCQKGLPEKDSDKARMFGEFTCDIPYITAEKQLEWLGKNEKIDLILWTGDSVSHDLHSITHTDVIHSLKNLTQLIKKHLPGVPMIPAMGNHDFHPPNYQSFSVSFSDHLDQIGDIWSSYIPKDSLQKFKEYGYYRMDLPKNLSGASPASVIVLNTQSCYNFNFGLFNETNDAASQLLWLRHQLQDLEKEGKAAYIIGHIPPGDAGCIKKWSVRYNALMERYQHVVRFATFGHDHRELYEVVRSFSSNKPINVNHVSGSLGTYMKVNPSVRIYKMHKKYHVPVNYRVLEFNLDDANNGNPHFKHFVSMKEEFHMKSMSPSEFSNLSERFFLNESDALKYVKYQWKNGPHGELPQCDSNCRRSLHCDTYFGFHEQKIICNDLNFNVVPFFEFALGAITNPWVIPLN